MNAQTKNKLLSLFNATKFSKYIKVYEAYKHYNDNNLNDHTVLLPVQTRDCQGCGQCITLIRFDVPDRDIFL